MNAVMIWLMTPLSGAPTHDIESLVFWHARLMVLAWGILLPAGALVARYFKVLPSQDWPASLDNKLWWHAHRTLQWGGVALASLAVYLVWQLGAYMGPLARWHGFGGWLLMFLGWLQILGGLARGSKGGPTDTRMRGDHYDMTKHRIWFERLHKGLGWCCLLAAIAVIAAGLMLADAPRWMPLLLALWWAALGALAWQWQKQGRCMDTYQAIWGPNPEHPGNRLNPIGWGIRRIAADKPCVHIEKN